jgi:hypothetical protein
LKIFWGIRVMIFNQFFLSFPNRVTKLVTKLIPRVNFRFIFYGKNDKSIDGTKTK